MRLYLEPGKLPLAVLIDREMRGIYSVPGGVQCGHGGHDTEAGPDEQKLKPSGRLPNADAVLRWLSGMPENLRRSFGDN